MNLLNLKEPLLVEDILPPSENVQLLKLLSQRPWYIQHEDNVRDFKTLVAFDNNTKHTGFVHITFDSSEKNYPGHMEDPLLIYSRIITQTILHKINAGQPNIYRIHWNYYLKGQEGTGHIDQESDRYVSILYNPHTTDGGTEIKNKFYKDKIGQAKIFKSNWNHRGVTTIEDKARLSLNIVLYY